VVTPLPTAAAGIGDLQRLPALGVERDVHPDVASGGVQLEEDVGLVEPLYRPRFATRRGG
jgi:hypothetical protein